MLLRIAAAYLLVAGLANLALPWLRLPFGPNHAEFHAQSPAYKLGARTRATIFGVAYALAGTGLFYHHAWARILALVILLIGTPFAANSFAWGFAEGRPTRQIFAVSLIAVVAWNGIWFFLIYRLAG